MDTKPKKVSATKVKADIARQKAQAKNAATLKHRNRDTGAGKRSIKTDHTSSGKSTGRSGYVSVEKTSNKIKAVGATKPKKASADKHLRKNAAGKVISTNRAKVKTAMARRTMRKK